MKAFTIKNLMTKKFDIMEFENEWLESFGNPEKSCTISVWGQSGSGKTTFLLMLIKYLSNFDRCLYNTREEGISETLRIAAERVGLGELKPGRVQFTNEDLEEQTIRLMKKKSPNIILNDSIQVMNFSKSDWISFSKQFSNKLFIWISQATPNGKHPSNNLGQFIRHSSDIKIHIEGYMAFFTSRFGGNNPFTIWPEGANKYWGFEYDEFLKK